MNSVISGSKPTCSILKPTGGFSQNYLFSSYFLVSSFILPFLRKGEIGFIFRGFKNFSFSLSTISAPLSGSDTPVPNPFSLKTASILFALRIDPQIGVSSTFFLLSPTTILTSTASSCPSCPGGEYFTSSLQILSRFLLSFGMYLFMYFSISSGLAVWITYYNRFYIWVYKIIRWSYKSYDYCFLLLFHVYNLKCSSLHLTTNSLSSSQSPCSSQHPPPPNPNPRAKKLLRLQKNQSLDLTLTKAIKIKVDKVQNSTKSHSIAPSYVSVSQDMGDQGAGLWNLTVTIRVVEGEGEVYFAPCGGFGGGEGLKREDGEDELEQQRDNYIRQYLHLKQGINTLSSELLKPLLQKQPALTKLFKGDHCLIIFPKKQARFILKLGHPEYEVTPINMGQTKTITVAKGAIDINEKAKIYLLNADKDFVVKFNRKKGFPGLKIHECPLNISCYVSQTLLPYPQAQPQKLRFSLSSMLAKSEQFPSQPCKACNLYLQLDAQPSSETQTQIDVSILPADFVTQLRENQIVNQEIQAWGKKMYGMRVVGGELVRVILQVYQGEVRIAVRESQGAWEYSPTRTTGVITVEIPQSKQASPQRQLTLQLSALSKKDSSYSLVYSSGQYQINLKDGYPTTHILPPKQTLSFLYSNPQPTPTPIYLSFNLNTPKALSALTMKIYTYRDSNTTQKQQYIPAKSTQQLLAEPRSFIVEIPGQWPRLEIVYESLWTADIELAVAIHDEEIIFLPLGYSLPLGIEPDGAVNLLVDNNEEGFIELIIKKCDESYPKIAYSLSPQDFMKQIYDYQSLGQNERITKSTIRIKKGGGLYIRITGDGLTPSFLQITASYLQADQKKLIGTNIIKKGSYGEISYQLITNSKAEIWFKQLECSQGCQRGVRYQCYWSTVRADMFKLMICPNIYMLRNAPVESNSTLAPISPITSSYPIPTQPDHSGIISFKHALNQSIIYLTIKATHPETKTQLIYQDIEIVTIAGQLGRMSTGFMFISIGIAICVTVLLFVIVRRQARLGYTAVQTSQGGRKRKTRLDLVKG